MLNDNHNYKPKHNVLVMPVVRIRILIGTTVVRIRILIGTTVVRIRVLIGTTVVRIASVEKFTQVHLRGIVTEPTIWCFKQVSIYNKNISPEKTRKSALRGTYTPGWCPFLSINIYSKDPRFKPQARPPLPYLSIEV